MKYLIKIYTQEIKTEFIVESKKPLDTMDEVHQIIIDYMGQNSIEWEPNSLQFNGTARGSEFYITYEEVKNGSGQDGVVR